MKTTYLKCHHGKELRFGCQDCENEKNSFYNGITSDLNQQTSKIPIYRGCTNKMCFCTGRCKEIIGYTENETI